ncbi:MAG: hypothetical protein K9L99_05920, partial [Candidatus Omnitrophica bacterium]|nr:hypothetical protein [Candidatus Omnitrophota bacterium]
MKAEQIKNKDFTESGVFNETQKERFKPWMKVIACVVIFCFLYQDIVRAASPSPIFAYGAPYNRQSMLQINPQQFNQLPVPEIIKSTLLQASSQKKATKVQFPSGRTLEINNPSSLDKEKIDHIYSLLQKKPCGTQSLYDYLRLSGHSHPKSYVSSVIFSVDLAENSQNFKAGINTKPEDLKSSLYAIEKASQMLEEPVEAVKLKSYFFGEKLNQITPFIAHLKYGHYVLVKEIKDGKIYAISNGEKITYSEKDFFDQFSEYALVKESSSLNEYSKVSDKEAKRIKGADGQSQPDFSSFSSPQEAYNAGASDVSAALADAHSEFTSSYVEGLAISAGVAVGGAIVGGAFMGGYDALKAGGSLTSGFTTGAMSGLGQAFSAAG